MIRNIYTFRVAAAAALLVAAPAFAQNTDGKNELAQVSMANMQHDVTNAMMEPSKESALAVLKGWQETPRKTGEAIIDKYGPPNEMTATRMVWLNNGPWKWSILTNDPTPHHFPVKHEDVLEQAISYDIPADKVDELANYDGSVVANRTQGELSARCDKEAANFLALNLANDVATGAKSVDDARDYYSTAIDTFMQEKKMDPYMKELVFTPADPSKSKDPDKVAAR